MNIQSNARLNCASVCLHISTSQYLTSIGPFFPVIFAVTNWRRSKIYVKLDQNIHQRWKLVLIRVSIPAVRKPEVASTAAAAAPLRIREAQPHPDQRMPIRPSKESSLTWMDSKLKARWNSRELMFSFLTKKKKQTRPTPIRRVRDINISRWLKTLPDGAKTITLTSCGRCLQGWKAQKSKRKPVLLVFSWIKNSISEKNYDDTV